MLEARDEARHEAGRAVYRAAEFLFPEVRLLDLLGDAQLFVVAVD